MKKMLMGVMFAVCTMLALPAMVEVSENSDQVAFVLDRDVIETAGVIGMPATEVAEADRLWTSGADAELIYTTMHSIDSAGSDAAFAPEVGGWPSTSA